MIACGTDDESILAAINHVKEIDGGMAVVKEGKVVASLSLDLAGLMSTKPHKIVQKDIQALEHALQTIGFNEDWDPFLTLAFLALPVIPALKLTDTGLFDVTQFKHVSIQGSH